MFDFPEFKIKPWDHIAIIHTWSMEHMCALKYLLKNVSRIMKIVHSALTWSKLLISHWITMISPPTTMIWCVAKKVGHKWAHKFSLHSSLTYLLTNTDYILLHSCNFHFWPVHNDHLHINPYYVDSSMNGATCLAWHLFTVFFL